MITFVIGGNKSGKSDYAMGLLETAPGPALFLATGKAKDLSFRSQIAAHRERRDPTLPVVEVGWDLPRALLEAKNEYQTVLVDSLDFWLYVCSQECRERELTEALLEALAHCREKHIILVSWRRQLRARWRSRSSPPLPARGAACAPVPSGQCRPARCLRPGAGL